MKSMILSAVLLMTSAAFATTGEPTLKATNFEREARAEARRQGWPGYPDSYEDAFLAGARWAKAKYGKKSVEVRCEEDRQQMWQGESQQQAQ